MAHPVFTGARARFFIDEKPIGYCAGVSGEEAIDYNPVETLEFLEVREHIPVAYRASLSAAFFRLINSSLKEYRGNQLEDAGGLSIFSEVQQHPDFGCDVCGDPQHAPPCQQSEW